MKPMRTLSKIVTINFFRTLGVNQRLATISGEFIPRKNGWRWLGMVSFIAFELAQVASPHHSSVAALKTKHFVIKQQPLEGTQWVWNSPALYLQDVVTCFLFNLTQCSLCVEYPFLGVFYPKDQQQLFNIAAKTTCMCKIVSMSREFITHCYKWRY